MDARGAPSVTVFWRMISGGFLMRHNRAYILNSFYCGVMVLLRAFALATAENLTSDTQTEQSTTAAQKIAAFCAKVDQKYRTLNWGPSPCAKLPWQFDMESEKGQPLIYIDFDFNSPNKFDKIKGTETTLILGGVHPDEITPIHLVFKFAQELAENPSLYANRRVVVAPLVNPDAFLSNSGKRTNARGVDLNRNFPTKDWAERALKYWRQSRKSNPRHFPGFAAQSEKETQFQIKLLEQFEPDKIISVHAPLGFLDYDGPGDSKHMNLTPLEKKARDLANVISRNANNYQVRDYNFYPGSLGNYSGNERNIPTLTLELKSSDPRKVHAFWKEFSPGLKAAVSYEFRKKSVAQSK